MAATVVPVTRVVTFWPVALAGVVAVTLVASGAPAGVPMRLSIAGACLAASAAYVIDDAGAVTVASSPTSLFIRRAVRAATAAAGVGAAWTVAVLVADVRVDAIGIGPATVELAAFLVLALAVSAVSASTGDGTDGAIAGVVVTAVCFGSKFLPGSGWLPFPSDPTAPGAAGRLSLVLAAAAVVFAFASRDPSAASASSWRRVHRRDTQQGGGS